MENLTIRLMAAKDLSAVREIELEATGRNTPFTTQLLSWMRVPNNTALVAQTPEGLAGYLTYRFHVTQWYLIIVHLAVRPAWRRRGVGSALVERMLDGAGSLIGARVCAVVAEKDKDSQRFLCANGFRAVKILAKAEAKGQGNVFLYQFENPHDTNHDADDLTIHLSPTP